MKEIWLGIGVVILISVVVGIILSCCEFVYRAWLHINKGHTDVKKIDKQYSFPNFKGTVEVDEKGRAKIEVEK